MDKEAQVMKIIVQKFGGTSVGSIERIRNVANRVIQEVEKGNKVVVVVSAMGKSTDDLAQMALQISKNLVNVKWICC
jgi:aspartate kinase